MTDVCIYRAPAKGFLIPAINNPLLMEGVAIFCEAAADIPSGDILGSADGRKDHLYVPCGTITAITTAVFIDIRFTFNGKTGLAHFRT